jgi:hypothetical protein
MCPHPHGSNGVTRPFAFAADSARARKSDDVVGRIPGGEKGLNGEDHQKQRSGNDTERDGEQKLGGMDEGFHGKGVDGKSKRM